MSRSPAQVHLTVESEVTLGDWTPDRHGFPWDGKGSRWSKLSAHPDTERSEKPLPVGGDTESRMLALPDQPVPDNCAQWNRPLLVKALGDLSADQAWRIPRSGSIQLQRRRIWRITNDREPGQEAALRSTSDCRMPALSLDAATAKNASTPPRSSP